MVYETINGSQVWVNSSSLFQNISNSTDPIGAVAHIVNTGIPFFWPFLSIILYLWLFLVFSDAPSGGKLYMITAIALIISVFLALGGSIVSAVINFMIFGIVFFLGNQFKHV